jgi:hypothetical protein
VKDNDLAAAVSPGMVLSDGDVSLGSQIGGASVEKDQGSGGGWASADPSSCLDPVTDRWKSPDFTPERQDFHRTAHLGQGGRLGDGPAKPSQQQQAAEDERDQGEHRFQGRLQGGHGPGYGGSSYPLPKDSGNPRSITGGRSEWDCLSSLLLGQCPKHPALPGDEGDLAGGWSGCAP